MIELLLASTSRTCIPKEWHGVNTTTLDKDNSKEVRSITGEVSSKPRGTATQIDIGALLRRPVYEKKIKLGDMLYESASYLACIRDSNTTPV